MMIPLVAGGVSFRFEQAVSRSLIPASVAPSLSFSRVLSLSLFGCLARMLSLYLILVLFARPLALFTTHTRARAHTHTRNHHLSFSPSLLRHRSATSMGTRPTNCYSTTVTNGQ